MVTQRGLIISVVVDEAVALLEESSVSAAAPQMMTVKQTNACSTHEAAKSRPSSFHVH